MSVSMLIAKDELYIDVESIGSELSINASSGHCAIDKLMKYFLSDREMLTNLFSVLLFQFLHWHFL